MAGDSDVRNRLKLAELTSGVGALVLGVGLGVLFASTLRQSAAIVLVTGGLLHGWGMLDKHRLETSGAAHQVWWVNFLYWVCWAALGGLVIYLIVRR